MVQPRLCPTPWFSVRQFVFAAAFIVGVTGAVLVTAQTAEWRLVDNPYQEDVPYTINEVFEPGVTVEGVRWLSFSIVSPNREALDDEQPAQVDARVVMENRRPKSAKILVILLLEDADGRPLERIEIRQFKVPGNRVKDRTETVELSKAVLDDTRRAYIFLEVVH